MTAPASAALLPKLQSTFEITRAKVHRLGVDGAIDKLANEFGSRLAQRFGPRGQRSVLRSVETDRQRLFLHVSS